MLDPGGIRTARAEGYRTVAVYSEADAGEFEATWRLYLEKVMKDAFILQRRGDQLLFAAQVRDAATRDAIASDERTATRGPSAAARAATSAAIAAGGAAWRAASASAPSAWP